MPMGKPVADMTGQASWDLTRRSCWLTSPVTAQYPMPRNCINSCRGMDSVCRHLQSYQQLESRKRTKKVFYERKTVDFFVPQLKWQKGGVRKKSNNTIYAYHGNTHPQVLQAPQISQIFTGQGIEKNNNMAHGIILRKSNKWILLGMSSNKKDVNGSLKNMKGRYEIT